MYDTPWHALTAAEVLEKLQTNLEQGLETAEITRRQKIYPANRLSSYKREHFLWRFLRQFHNALIYILLVSATITLYLELWIDASVILGVVIINAIFGFFQENKAENALSAIRNMLAPTARVIRDGRRINIPASELVPGDIIVISRGDKVPADLRICEAKNLQAQEAALTGESLPVEKNAEPVAENKTINDRYSMLYAGTLIVDGRGLGIVVATGSTTEVGKISEALVDTAATTTPLIRQMDDFGRWLTVGIVAFALIVFLVGIVFWHSLVHDMLIAIVGLTVAAIPEGLPPILTIILALGVTRMAQRKAIIRQLPAVETMGAVTTICTDKTGTLTSNELSVQTIVTTKQTYNDYDKLQLEEHFDLKTAIISGILCNDAELQLRDDTTYEASGNPLDVALMNLGMNLKLEVHLWQQKLLRTDTIPYETEHKFMATLHHDHEGGYFIYIKGAPEIVLRRCQNQQAQGKIEPLDIDYWQRNIEKLAGAGQRVIAVAKRQLTAQKQTLSFDDIDGDLVLVAIFGLIDPPREEAVLAIEECLKAGINVKMITGDHAFTAKKIAANVGIKTTEILTGDAIDNMDDGELALVAPKVDIYARTAPQHKLRLVKALQQQEEIVAMTGDGINDAPALKQAEIGIAMGKKGADLARESADMVLADDNFATIVQAISEGRTIFDNLQKAIVFILPTNFAESLAIVIAIILGLTLPITAVQILWVNMITAVTLSLALGFEPADPRVMQRPPRDSRAPLLSRYLVWRSFFVASILVAVVFGLFMFAHNNGISLKIARTTVVNALVFCEAFYLINCRYLKKSSINRQAFLGSNPILIAIGAVTVLQLLFTYLPLMQRFFGTAPIGLIHWFYISLASLLTFVLIEAEKKIADLWPFKIAN
jgi:calcium-translocating P-type ATPase